MKTVTQSQITKLYVAIAIVAVLAILSIGISGQTMNIVNNLDAGHTHPEKSLEHTESFDNTDNQKALTNIETQLKNQRDEYTREIVAVKKDLQNAQIGTGDSQKDKLNEQSGSSTSPKLTIHLDSDTFIRGEIIWVSGTADPSKSVEATVKDSKFNVRYPTANADVRGDYKIAVTTDFESELGTYTVFVRSQGETSQTLSFVLKQ